MGSCDLAYPRFWPRTLRSGRWPFRRSTIPRTLRRVILRFGGARRSRARLGSRISREASTSSGTRATARVRARPRRFSFRNVRARSTTGARGRSAERRLRAWRTRIWRQARSLTRGTGTLARSRREQTAGGSKIRRRSKFRRGVLDLDTPEGTRRRSARRFAWLDRRRRRRAGLIRPRDFPGRGRQIVGRGPRSPHVARRSTFAARAPGLMSGRAGPPRSRSSQHGSLSAASRARQGRSGRAASTR